MTPAKTAGHCNSEFPGKLHGLPPIFFSLSLLLGALSTVFSEAPVFAGITVFVLGAVIFTQARSLVPVLGILTPALFLIATTGNLTIPSIYIGFIYSFGVSAYLMIGYGWFRALSPVLSAYIAAAIVLGPIEALPVFIPSALGILASPMLLRRPLSETLSLLTFLMLGGGLIAFLLSGSSLADSAEFIRTYIVDLYKNVSEEILVIEERYLEMLAAYFVNILPGLLFASVSLICYISCALTAALFNTSSDWESPETMRVLSLSPASGVIYIFCFFLSAAFALEGPAYEMAGAVTDNILIALTLPFTLMGCSATAASFRRKFTTFSPSHSKIPLISIAIFFLISPSVASAVFTFIGIWKSVKPITSAILRKLTRTDRNKNK